MAVFGCGPVGPFSVGVARASGAGPIFAIEEFQAAFDLMLSPERKCGKVVLIP